MQCQQLEQLLVKLLESQPGPHLGDIEELVNLFPDSKASILELFVQK